MRGISRGREDTAIAYHLTRKRRGIGSIRTRDNIRESTLDGWLVECTEVEAIVVGGQGRRLPGDLSDVVAETYMRSRVVILNQLPFFQQGAVEVDRRR